jgi:hypothetical protein
MKVEEARYSVAEIADWFRRRELTVNSDYQRGGGLWSAPAKTYFIDTILRGFPFPKVYFHEKVERASKRPKREIVDGQQRIGTIVDFVDGKLRLGSSAPDYEGLVFSDLSDQQQDDFLAYTVAVDVIRNADRADILQMFRRMNAYTLPLNEAEKRQSTFFGEFKSWINSVLDEYGSIIVDWNILSSRQIVRMVDAEVIADIALAVSEGIVSTSPKKLRDLYAANDKEFAARARYDEQIAGTLAFVRADMSFIQGTFLTKSHIFHSLMCALIQNRWGLPNGLRDTGVAPMHAYWNSRELAERGLLRLAAAHEERDSSAYGAYVDAASEGGNRAAQRAIRIDWLCRALRGELE